MAKAKLVVNIELREGEHWSPALTEYVERILTGAVPNVGRVVEVSEYLAEAGGEDRPDNTMEAQRERMYPSTEPEPSVPAVAVKRIRTITGHTSLARYLTGVSENPYREVQRHSEIPSPYAFSPTHTTFLLTQSLREIFWVETRHARYEIFEVVN